MKFRRTTHLLREDIKVSNLTAVIVLAADKESLINSLVHVDQLLKQVEKRIATERSLLKTVGRRNAGFRTTPKSGETQVTIDGISNEDYAKLWFGHNKFNDQPKTKRMSKDRDADMFKGHKDYRNYQKTVATLDKDEFHISTMKLVDAVQGLKGLVEADVKVKKKHNSSNLATLQKIKEKFKKKTKSKDIMTKIKRNNDRNNDDFDVFEGMEFPDNSNLPNGISTKEVPPTVGGTPPDILNEGFIVKHEDMPGPGIADMLSQSTTTDDPEHVLDPRQFGLSTTARTLPTYGDIKAPPTIDARYLKTTPAPDDFVAGLKDDMKNFHMGVFCIAVLKLIHIIIWKDQPVAQRIVHGFGETMAQMWSFRKFKEFGEPTQDAINRMSQLIHDTPFDEIKSEAVLLHNGLLHRRELFSLDVNSLLDHVDSLYTREETMELLKSLEPLNDYQGQEIPYTMLDTLVNNFLAPWRRIKETIRGNILKVALNKAIKNHFYTGDKKYDTRRAMNINIPVDFMPSDKPADVTPDTAPPLNFRNANIKVYRIDSRRDDLNRNIYNTDLQTIYKNFMRYESERARKSQVNMNAKPLFNKQSESKLNIMNNKELSDKQEDFFNRFNKKPVNPLRIKLVDTKITSKPMNNDRIMIITNNNQKKSNIMDRPRAIIKSANPYIDLNNKVNSKPVNNNRIMIITNNNQAKRNIMDKPEAVIRSGDSFVDLNSKFNNKATSKPVHNNRIMIITNNNQGKSNIMGKPSAIFRSADSYADLNMMNVNDTLGPDADQFQLDMYPDVPLTLSEQPSLPPPPPPTPPPPPPPRPPSELNFEIEGDNLKFQVDGDKEVIVINKKADAPMASFREDIDLAMTSSSSSILRKRKHHKKHHKKHKRTHGHGNLREKLAKIKKIVKRYRSGHKKSKHKRHHKSEKHKQALRSLSIKQETLPSLLPEMRNVFNATQMKSVSDRRFQDKDLLSTTRTPQALEYSTQVYAVKSNFMNGLRRQMRGYDANKVNLAIQKVHSDEEIALKRNLYKAMSVEVGEYPRRSARKSNKRKILRKSGASDEEAQLKRNIYSYFNNIQPE